jgi:hypothetical protein
MFPDRYTRCGVISPTIYLVIVTCYDHQRHLLAKPADTTWWRSRWNAGEKHGRWILPTSTYRTRRVLLHAVNLRHRTDGWTLGPVASTLTTRPPRATTYVYMTSNYVYICARTRTRDCAWLDVKRGKRSAYRILIGQCPENLPLWRPSWRWDF